MKKIFTTVVLTLAALAVQAQKTIYIPNEWRNPWPADSLLYAEQDPDNKYTWSKSRSVESENVIVFWDKGYGSTLPSKAPTAYRVDEQDLLRKCEAFYDLEINRLGFVDPVSSNLAKYKVMVLLNHTTDWVCYGSGYDFEVSALWLGPSACKPVGHSVAHEVGHSFHYMCFAEHSGHRDSNVDGTGFHLPVGNGQTIWEQTAQWQANQSYPELMFDQSIGVFRKSHNLAFTHEWHRYQSYWFLYYLCQHYGDVKTVAQVWNQPMNGASDFNQALMKLKGLTPDDLYRLYYDYASRCATWDFDAAAPYRDRYIGDLQYRCVQTAERTYQVALASVPEATGFNVIPLQVPAAGTRLTTHFTALPASSTTKLAPGDPAEMMNGETNFVATGRTGYIRPAQPLLRAFRLGYVALMQDGSRQYYHEDSLYCKTNDEVTADVAMTVPEGVSRLWLIVVPAPQRYVQHLWKESIANADQWPYRFALEGTDIGSEATVYVEPTIDGREVADVTLTYDVYFPTAADHSGTTLTVSGQAAAMLGTALQLQPSAIAGLMQDYSATGPSAGRMMFYAVSPSTGALVQRGSTANGYGHWFSSIGNVTDYGNGYVYSEFAPSTLTFSLGQYPGRLKEGSVYTIRQALRYKTAEGREAVARFVFRIHADNSRPAGAQLASVDYAGNQLGVQPVYKLQPSSLNRIYNLKGHRLSVPQKKGISIVNGKKLL